MRFVDTNVLLYAVSTTPSEAAKASVARDILEAEDLALSVQALQEFYVQATRPGRSGRLSHGQAALLVEAWLRFPVQETTVALVRGESGGPVSSLTRRRRDPAAARHPPATDAGAPAVCILRAATGPV